MENAQSYYEREINVHEFTQGTHYERQLRREALQHLRKEVWLMRLKGVLALLVAALIGYIGVKIEVYEVFLALVFLVLPAIAMICTTESNL